MILYEPHVVEAREALARDIARRGVDSPIVISRRSGVVISGATRAAIADELGIAYATTEVDYDDEDDETISAALANPVRRLTPDGREAVIGAMRRKGWGDRRIAAALGVDEATVRSTAGYSAVDRRTSRNGKKYPARRSTERDLARRDADVKRLRDSGLSRREIAATLGISDGSVSNSIRRAGIQLPVGGQPRRLGTPVSPTVPSYRSPRSILAVIENVEREYADLRWASLAASHVEEANAVADTEWLSRYRAAAAAFVEDARRLLRVADDPDFRERQRRQIDGSAPRELPTRLRAVE